MLLASLLYQLSDLLILVCALVFSEEVIGAIFGAGNCSTYHCYKGGPEEPPAGLETAGCPVYSHPAQLVDNRNCVLCMTCDKARAPQLPLKHSLRLSDSLSYFPPVQDA